MNEQTNSQHGFEADYRTLNLHENADWRTTRVRYRKLVHKWHPDKYSDRPKDLEFAQKKFIALTKAYNRLKAFHSLHKRLPFEHTTREEIRADAVLNIDSVTASKKSRADQEDLDKGTFSRDESKTDERLIKKSPLTRILWIIITCIVIVGTIMLFFVLDQKANQRNRIIGEQVLKEAPESEFIPTPSEIRRSESKGAFIRNTN